MTRQQELELLAEWLGIEGDYIQKAGLQGIVVWLKLDGEFMELHTWNPLTNDTDFLNMVAGRVMFRPTYLGTTAYYFDGLETSGHLVHAERHENHNNYKLAAMKHAAYQVCLMAAREWKSGQ